MRLFLLKCKLFYVSLLLSTLLYDAILLNFGSTKFFLKILFGSKTIHQLREDDVFYFKVEKCNKVIIIDKTNYYERINTSLNNGQYINATLRFQK